MRARTLLLVAIIVFFSATLGICDGPEILTPKVGDKPRINSAEVFGVRAGSPFLFTVAATGKQPMKFGAEDLPAGLVIDETNGRITGKIISPEKREYRVTVWTQNSAGRADEVFRIIVGETIALTPPLGWNSWNCWGPKVTAENVKASAKAMVDSGLINYGWTYINIDDGWQGERGGKYNAIMPSENFGDMAELCEYIHSLGLKVGIYSTPWVTSYASFIGGSSDNAEGKWNDPEGKLKRVHGKYKFDVNDAKQWGQWGIDYLKYDWRPNDVETVKRMSQALRGSGRDIVYSLSNSAPIENALELVKWANCWRTTGDIRDQWDNGRLSRKGGHCGIIDIWRFHSQWRPFNRPGHYNDADMMVIGNVGGPWSKEIRPCGLSFDEQYTHISSWVLFAGPMLIGCPLEQMDEFTLGLLSNAEVLEINQDTLCLQAETSKFNDSIWFKKLSDGSTAAGIFNRSDAEREMTCVFKYIKVNGRQKVRDLWKQEDIGEFDTSFSVKVNSHGVRLVRITGVK